MTQVCVSTSASSLIFSCSSNPSFLSETLKPSLSFKRDLRRSFLKNRKNLVAKAFSPDQSSRYGMRWMRDDVVVPYSPYCPVYANEEEEEQEHEHGGWVERGPPLMVAERFMAATTQLFQHRIIRCGGPVEDDMATMIVSQLLFLDAVDPESDIVMYINSPGGSVTAGMAIFDTMKHIRPDVSTVCVGLAASMGAFLLSAGTKGKRFSLPHARIMIHQPSGGAEGEESDMEIQCNEILHHKANLGAYLAYLCDQPIDRINRDTSRDFFMGAKEATDYGLIDGIIGLDGTKRLQPLAAS